MKYLIIYFALASAALAATGDIQIKQKTAIGSWREETIPVTNSSLLGFDSSGKIGKISSVPLLNVDELNLTGNVLPLPPGAIAMWTTSDIANKPTNTLVCDGTNGTPTVTMSDADATAIVVANPTLTAPSVTPASGTYTSAQTVTATADAGATVFYAIGADPTRASSVYSAPITASTTAEYRFAQAKSPGLLSPITTRSYTISLGSGYVSAVLADSPIAYWRLNDDAPSGAGSIADFSAGGTYDATPVGGIAWNQWGSLADGLGEAALFNGSTGYATGGAALANALMLSPAWTIELWYNPNVVNGGCLFAAAADATHRVRINHYAGKVTTSSTVGGNKHQLVATTSDWHHVVLTSAGDLYVDGIAQAGTNSIALNSTNQITVGSLNDGSAPFNGRVAEVSLYQTALNSTQVAAHFNAAVVHTLPTGQTFGMSMASATPELVPPGSDDSGTFLLGATIVDDGGANVLECGGATFRCVTFDNPLLIDQWCSKNAGTLRLQFKYTGTLGQFMLSQISGKDLSLREDTNDAVQLRVSPTGAEARFIHQGGSRIITTTQTFVENTWYDAEVKWNSTTSPYMTVTINGVSATSTVAGEVGNWLCTTAHLVLIGNDTPTTPTSLKIRNVEIYGSQQ